MEGMMPDPKAAEFTRGGPDGKQPCTAAFRVITTLESSGLAPIMYRKHREAAEVVQAEIDHLLDANAKMAGVLGFYADEENHIQRPHGSGFASEMDQDLGAKARTALREHEKGELGCSSGT